MRLIKRDTVGFIIASRIPNLLIIAFTQTASAYFLLEVPTHELMTLKFSLFLIGTAMIGAGGYIINDYFDQKIDMVNRPEKVVVGTDLRRRLALLAHSGLSLGGIALGFAIDPMIGAIHIFSAGALFTYSAGLRRFLLIGTLTIAFLASLCLLILLVYFKEFNLIVIAYALFACVTIFIRESIKDIISAKGERVFGIESVPIVWGIRGAKLVIFLAGISGLLFLVFYLWAVPNWIVRYFFVGVSIFIGWLFYQLGKADRIKDFERLKKSTDAIILLGLISVLLV